MINSVIFLLELIQYQLQSYAPSGRGKWKLARMKTYLMMLYVSLEQEKAVKHLFETQGWNYTKLGRYMYFEYLVHVYFPLNNLVQALCKGMCPSHIRYHILILFSLLKAIFLTTPPCQN